MIRLQASSDRGCRGQYIARITGRDPSGQYTFSFTFLGQAQGEITVADVDTPGLYTCCNVDRRRGKQWRYILILPAGELEWRDCREEDARKIGTALDRGRPIEDIAILDGDSYRVITATEARRRKSQLAAMTNSIDAAAEECWLAISAALDGLERPTHKRRLMTALRKKMREYPI